MFSFKNVLNLSPARKIAIKNIFWAVLGKCVNLAGALIVGIIVARYLGKEQYGLMNYVISYVAIFQVLADFGLDQIQIREEARHPENSNKIIGTTFGLKVLLAICIYLLIIITIFLFETDGRTASYILIYATSILLNTSWVSRNHFTSIVWNEYVVKTEISRTLIGIVVKGCLLFLHASLTLFICSLVFDSLLLAVGYTISYIKIIEDVRRWQFDLHLAQFMIGQSFPLLLSGAAIVIYNRIDQVMIGKMIEDKGELGIYSVAVRFVEVLTFVPTIIAQTVSPMLVKSREEDAVRYQSLASDFMSLTVWCSLLMAIIVSLIAYPLVYYTFGPEYIAAVSVLSILSFKVVGDSLSQTSGQLIIIEGIQKYSALRNLIGCIICIIFNYFCIPRYGILGAAIVSIFTILCSGFFANLIIPSYRHLFYLQSKTMIFGWKGFTQINNLFK